MSHNGMASVKLTRHFALLLVTTPVWLFKTICHYFLTQLFFLTIYISYAKGPQSFQKSRSHYQIVGTRRVT